MILLLKVSTIILFILLILSMYGTYNSLRKVEIYEREIENFYARVEDVLVTMKNIDERQMFEKDDDVGSVFQQLTIILGELRSLLYEENEETK